MFKLSFAVSFLVALATIMIPAHGNADEFFFRATPGLIGEEPVEDVPENPDPGVGTGTGGGGIGIGGGEPDTSDDDDTDDDDDQ